MLSYILTIIVTIFVWEFLKDLLNIRNVFNKYDGLSTEEMLAVRGLEEKNMEKKQRLKENEEEESFIDD